MLRTASLPKATDSRSSTFDILNSLWGFTDIFLSTSGGTDARCYSEFKNFGEVKMPPDFGVRGLGKFELAKVGSGDDCLFRLKYSGNNTSAPTFGGLSTFSPRSVS